MKGLKVNMISCVLLVVVLVLVIVCCAKQTNEEFKDKEFATEICPVYGEPGIGWNRKKNRVKNGSRRKYINCLARWLLDKGRKDFKAGTGGGVSNVQNMGKCLYEGGVNMKGEYPGGIDNGDDSIGGASFGKGLINYHINIRSAATQGRGINPKGVKNSERRSTIECLEDLIP